MKNGFDQTPFEVKQTVKLGLIYLLIAFPFVLIVATVLTIIKAPLALIIICNVVVGGIVVFIEMLIHNKIEQKKQENSNTKFDPFKD